MSTLGAIVMLSALVFFVMVHEAGHYVSARLTGMKVTEFFFGFGPRLWATVRGETTYGVKAIPAGGYVRITGMNPFESVDPADAGRTYREKKFWEKSVVVLAGVALHFVMAYLIVLLVIALFGVPTGEVQLTVAAVVPESPAAASGVQDGDRIVTLDGEAITDWGVLVEEIRGRPGSPVVVIVERDGELVSLSPVIGDTHPDSGEKVGYFGIVPEVTREFVGPFRAAGMAGRELITMIATAYEALFNLVRPDSLAKLAAVFTDGGESLPDNLRPTSPLGVAQIGAQVGALGLERFLVIMAFLNVFLGVLNGLPIYPLDGGHFAVAIYERVTHRRADVRKLAPIAAMVVVLLVFIGMVGLFLDIVNPINFG
ncbi:MAG: RIP metalloprotease [Acidimicrobiia bacterium]